jgi:thiamine-phosphate pyrophosphorylase
VVGVDQLRALRRLSSRPLVAIGGVTLSNVRTALSAGADSVAVIAELFPEQPHPSALRRRAAQWLAAVEGE